MISATRFNGTLPQQHLLHITHVLVVPRLHTVATFAFCLPVNLLFHTSIPVESH